MVFFRTTNKLFRMKYGQEHGKKPHTKKERKKEDKKIIIKLKQKKTTISPKYLQCFQFLRQRRIINTRKQLN